MPNPSLTDKYGGWALVIGASSGIGEAFARYCAAAGMNVVIVARRAANLESTAQSIRATHAVDVRIVEADTSTQVGVDAIIAGTEDLEIGLLVPCAAVESKGYFVDQDPATADRMDFLNVSAPSKLARHFGGRMASRHRGAIVLISSLSGYTAGPFMAQYHATKAYILVLGESLHVEMKDKNVDVTVLSPGPVDTPMIADMKADLIKGGMTIMSPDEVVRIAFQALGRKPSVVAGFKNSFIVGMQTRIMSRAGAGRMLEPMLRKMSLGAQK